jgi:hypothetical protein
MGALLKDISSHFFLTQLGINGKREEASFLQVNQVMGTQFFITQEKKK